MARQLRYVEVWGDGCTDSIKPRGHSTIGEKARFYFWRILGQDEPNSVWFDKVLFDTRHQVPCVTWNICKAVVGDPGEEVSDEEHQVATKIKEALSLPDEGRILH